MLLVLISPRIAVSTIGIGEISLGVFNFRELVWKPTEVT
jgi:hypothetical protein